MRFALALLTVAASLLNAQTSKPNLSGTYEIDGASRPVTLTVQHNEPSLKLSYARERTEEINLTTDGVDHVRDLPKGESRMSARWDGNVLEIRNFTKLADREITRTERWTLDNDLIVEAETVAKPADGSGSPTKRSSRSVYRKKS